MTSGSEVGGQFTRGKGSYQSETPRLNTVTVHCFPNGLRDCQPVLPFILALNPDINKCFWNESFTDFRPTDDKHMKAPFVWVSLLPPSRTLAFFPGMEFKSISSIPILGYQFETIQFSLTALRFFSPFSSLVSLGSCCSLLSHLWLCPPWHRIFWCIPH